MSERSPACDDCSMDDVCLFQIDNDVKICPVVREYELEQMNGNSCKELSHD